RATRLAGVSAVVLKGADLFIAQTGPALVYVLHGGTTARFPEDSPWLEMSPRQAMEQGYAPPLGLRAELSVDLFHYEVEAGDTLVLAESSVAALVDEEEAAILFGSEGDAANDARLQALFREKDVSLVLVRVGDADEGMGEPRRVQRLTALAGARTTETAPSIPRPVRANTPTTPREALRSAGEWVTWGSARVAETGRNIWRRMLPGSDRLRSARALRRRPVGLSLTPQEPRSLTDDRLVLVGMLAGLAIVGAIIYGVVRWQAGRMQASRYERTVQSVQAKLTEASETQDQAAARAVLLEADVLLNRASAMPQAGDDAEELSRQLGEQLDEIDGVERLYWLPVLRQYTDAGSAPTRVLSHGIDVYVLDAGLGRVYKYLFNPMTDGLQELGEGVPEVLLRTGDVRGDVTVGQLVDMAWMPPGPDREWGSLLVLDASGALLEYEPSSGIKVLPTGPRSSVDEARKIAGIEGRLLLLDAGANQVMVYEPGTGSYETAGLPYTNADLMMSGVVDMAVDGDVYLLYADGLVAKLRGGEQMPFEMTGLDARLSNPTAMCVTAAVAPDNPGYIYIADAGNQRIVQLTKDGQFVRQFKPKRGDESFANVTGLYVDEEAGKIEILTGNGLLLANLPQ
ncbi:MAG: NHL repeat-containing protein, partial [Anaerolineae bacterium]